MIQNQTLALDDLEAHESYQDCTIVLPMVPGKVTDVTLRHCAFQGALDHTEWLDCQFIDLDLANRSWSAGVLYRCQFRNCNLLGTNFLASIWKQTTLENCRGDYANFSGAKLTRCRMKQTSLHEVYFREVTFRQGFVLTDCELDDASFWESSLAGVDLSASTFVNLEVPTDPRLLKGLCLSAYQAADVLSGMGITIK